MKYTKLTAEQQAQMLEQRLLQYEQEHFSHQTNKDLLVASGDDSDDAQDALKQADKALTMIEAAHAHVKSQLDDLTDTRDEVGAARAKGNRAQRRSKGGGS